jgi:aryl-alcohol dehydrogenase-like predicted oxidoreductase
MKTFRLGSQGLEVSALGLGCMGMGTTYSRPDEQESRATIARALERGVTLFDTAEVYGPFTNEMLVGNALKGKRDRVVIATKVGFEFTDQGRRVVVNGLSRVTGEPAYIRKAVERSLGRLATDYIDLLYLHRIDPHTPIEETIGLLGELVREGKVRFIGVSEASQETIRRAHATHPLTAVQSEYSMFERGIERDGVLSTVRELGIGLVSYSPLGRGFLTGSLRSLDHLVATDFRRTDPRFQAVNLKTNIKLVERITGLAESKGVTPAQLAIAWVMHAGTVPIPGTTKVQNLDQNIAAADIKLSHDDLVAVNEAVPVGAAVGDRYGPGMIELLDH